MWLLGLGLAAHGHPVGSRHATQTTQLRVYRDHVEVDFIAEVPDEIVRTARPGDPDPVDDMARELTSGLLMTVDGAVRPMTLLGETQALEGPDHVWMFRSTLGAPLPEGPTEIAVATANLPEGWNFFAGAVQLDPARSVRACSLLPTRDGQVARDDSLRWRREEQARTLTLELGRTTPRVWAWLWPPARELVPARGRFRPRPFGPGEPARFVVTLALAAGVGAALGRAAGRSPSLPNAAIGLVAVAAVVVDTGGLRTSLVALLALAVGAAASPGLSSRFRFAASIALALWAAAGAWASSGH